MKLLVDKIEIIKTVEHSTKLRWIIEFDRIKDIITKIIRIVIFLNLEEIEKIGIKNINVAILHEMGHFIDYQKIESYSFYQKYHNEKKYTLLKEVIAWNYAFKMYCLLYHKKPNKEFYDAMNFCLRSYAKYIDTLKGR